jgi:hypothetical protein
LSQLVVVKERVARCRIRAVVVGVSGATAWETIDVKVECIVLLLQVKRVCMAMSKSRTGIDMQRRLVMIEAAA